MSTLVTKPAPDFTANAVLADNSIDEQFSLSSLRGKYVVLFFYPLDFTFVCPTEILAFDEFHDQERAALALLDSEERGDARVVKARERSGLAVEAGVAMGWERYVGLEGEVIGIDRFGESAPAGQLFEYFGFTVDNVVKAVNSIA